LVNEQVDIKYITFVVLYLPCMPVVSGCLPLLKLWQTVERLFLLILADLTPSCRQVWP